MGDKKSKTQPLYSELKEKELRILMLEDNPADAEMIENKLSEEGIVFLAKRVDTREDFVKELKNFAPDLILADYSLPSFDGLSALSIAQETHPDVPVIIVSGVIGEYLAIETLKKGATDYVLKDRLSRLVPVVKRALREAEEQAERKRTEKALMESEGKYHMLFDKSLDGIALADAETGILLDCNQSLADLVGRNREGLIGQHQSILHPPSSSNTGLSSTFTQHLTKQEGQILETQVLIATGEIREVEIKANLLYIQGKKMLQGIFRDITERKQAEEKLNHLLEILRKAKEEWEMTFYNVMELIIIIDKDLRIIRCNKSFAEFAGMPVNELTGKKCYDFFSCDYKQIGNCRVRSQTEKFACKNELKTESERWFYESNCPILDEKKNFLYSVVVATDITELKNSQQGFIQAQEELKTRIKELEDFYNMAVGREIRMIELKEEIDGLKEELAKYKKI